LKKAIIFNVPFNLSKISPKERRMRYSTVLIIFMMILLATVALAQNPTLINYQGKLSDNSGNPVPDANYQMLFSLYADSTGGTSLWNEAHPAISTRGGYFKVNMGSIQTFDGTNILERPALYLQIQIGSLPPLAPRIKFTSVPRSAVAARISGDFQTTDSSLILQNGMQTIGIHTGSENMGIVIEERPTDPVNRRLFRAGVDSGAVNLGFEGPNGQQMLSVSGKPGSLGKLTWGLFNPQPEPPGYDARLLMEASTSPSGKASWVMFNPQPEPPGSDPFKILEMNNGVGNEAGLYMFNPQPEPPGSDPFFGLKATSNGPSLNMYSPQVGGAILVNNHPQINIRCDSSASRMLLQRAFNSMAGPADSIGISMYADSANSELRFFKGNNINLKITTNSNGTSSSYIDDGSEYMGVEPSPWHAGGDLNMYDSTGAKSITLASNGKAGFIHDGSEYMGIEPSPWHTGGDLTMYSPTGGPTLILASNGMVSIGTSAHTNILTVQQYSPTDPISDAWTTYSSRRWKTNIQPLHGSLAKVMQLQGVSYDQKEGGKHDIGLIAEDVGKVVPEVVAYEDNGVDAKSIDYARLTALLIEAVKEQQKTIEELKVQISNIGKGNNSVMPDTIPPASPGDLN
jgi:hypothetical protein